MDQRRDLGVAAGEVIHQAHPRANVERDVLRGITGVAVHQQGVLGFVEGERGGQVARHETAAAARVDRHHQGDEVPVRVECQQPGAKLAEGIGVVAHACAAMDQAAVLEHSGRQQRVGVGGRGHRMRRRVGMAVRRAGIVYGVDCLHVRRPSA